MTVDTLTGKNFSRRGFLRGLGLAAAGTALVARPSSVLASNLVLASNVAPSASVHWVGEAREVQLFNANTQETISTVFYAHGQYNKQSFQQLCHFLRDHHENSTHWMDPNLLTLLSDMQNIFDKRQIHIISGYRTPQTNAMLRHKIPGVAKDSFHMKGQAVDIRVEGIDTAMIRDVARVMGVGGVGYYPQARFVHIDTGPIRHW